jgi:predicted ATPase
MRHFTITGAPGAGKTRVLATLAGRGYTVVSEAPRAIIRDRHARGLPPRPDPRSFAREILECARRGYRETKGPGPVLHDRGPLDGIAMGLATDLLTQSEAEALFAEFAMETPLIVFPPWAGIYRIDAERDQTFTEAGMGYRRLLAFLARWHLAWVEVPAIGVEARADFVADLVGPPTRPQDA